MAKKNAASGSKLKGMGSRSNDEWATKWNRELGQHFKAICQKHEYTAEMVGDVIALSSSSVNHVYAGTQPLTSSQAKLIAEKFGINWQYCYAVGDETPSAELQRLHDEYAVALAYLKTLGIEFIPGYYWHFLRSTLRDSQVDLLEKYIESTKDVEHLRTLLLDPQLDHDDALECVRLCADPTADPKIQASAVLRWSGDSQRCYIPLARLDQLTKHLNYASGTQLLDLSERNYKEMPNSVLVSIGYEVNVNGIFQKVISFGVFENMLHNVDRIAKAAALSALEMKTGF